MSVKNRAIIHVVLIFISLFLFSLYHIQKQDRETLETQLATQKKGFEDTVSIMESYAFSPYYARIQGIWKTNPEIVQAFGVRDREKLLRLMSPKFKVLQKENPYFSKMHFHLPDGRSFLRVHSPDMHSDDLSKIRHAVQLVHSEKRQVTAFERGKRGSFYRIIQPIFHQERYIGALEFGIRIELLTDGLRDRLQTPLALYYKATLLQGNAGIRTGEYAIIPDGDTTIEAITPQINLDLTSQRYSLEGHTYELQTFPILQDHQKTKIGGILILIDITELLSHQKKIFQQATFFALLLLLTIIILLYWNFGNLIGRLEKSQASQEVLLIDLQQEAQEREYIQERLTSSHQRFATVMENLDAWVLVIDAVSNEVLFSNSYAEKIFGNIQGKVCTSIFAHEQEGAGVFCPDLPLIHPDGEASNGISVREYFNPKINRWFELHEQPIRWVDDRLVHLKIATDITERKEAEDELRRNQARIARAQSIAHLGYWDWDMKENALTLSDETCRIFGIKESQEAIAPEVFFKHIHPKDREMVEEALGKAIEDQEIFSIDHRLAKEGGEERIIHQEAEILRDEAGKITQVLGAILDITSVRENSRQLLFSAKVFENSIEGIMLTNANGDILSVNQAFFDITGYSSEEVLGQNPRLLKSNRHDTAFYEDMWQDLLDNGNWQGEIWNRRKNGEIYPQWTTISTIRDEFGKTSNYAGVFHDMSEIKQREEQLRYQAQHDALTGLPNRLLFHDRLGVAMAHARRQQGKIAVLFLDLDNFKTVNDSLGHTVGDTLLVQVTERLNHAMRDDDTVARYGGDEFIIMLDRLEHEDEAIGFAQRIIAAIRDSFKVEGHELYVSFSIGISFYPADGDNRESLIKNADLAMYRAKASGKNTYQLFTEEMNKVVVKRLSMENRLRKGLENEEFQAYYQAKIDMASGAIAGAESLIRWKQNDGTLILPSEFIPIAEETGIIVEIGEWMLRHVCSQVKLWHDEDLSLPVAVNLSPRQFMKPELVQMIERVMSETAIPPALLEFEVTESMLMETGKAALAKLWAIREMGGGLAIDDFGIGYSSLSYLKKLPIQTIKIDRSFIHDIPHNHEDVAITSAIISMAHSLSLKLVAEGVETPQQLQFLRNQGCQLAQGFLFSKPVHPNEYHDLLIGKKRYNIEQ